MARRDYTRTMRITMIPLVAACVASIVLANSPPLGGQSSAEGDGVV